MKPKNASLLERWWQKVDRRGSDDECWPWTASRDKDGYGKFQVPATKGQRHVRAHVFAFETFVGGVPSDAHVCHSCDHPWCVNPRHLWVGTNLDNNNDKVAKDRHAKVWGVPLNRSRQTECKRGHPLEGENLRIVNGYRRCLACQAFRARRAYRQRRGLPGTGQPRPSKGVIQGRGQHE